MFLLRYWSTVLPSLPLCYCLFFLTLSHGVIPKSWKRAVIIPIYKSGDKTVPSNYCQISLTSVICNVLERMIRKQVFSFLDQKGCLNSTQHGFRPGRSCLPALLQGVHLSFKANSPVYYWDYQIQSPTIISTSPQNCPIFAFIITYIIMYHAI